MKRKDLERILKDHGFQLVRSTGHFIYSNGKISVPVPFNNEFNRGLTRRILQHAGIPKEFIKEVV